MSTPLHLVRLESPIGRIEIIANGQAVTSVSIARGGALPHDDEAQNSNDILDSAATQLGEYFMGERRVFDIPLHLTGTDFQRAVWEHLGTIGFGTVTSYGKIGESLGYRNHGRPVGGAVGANPVPIILGCHRVLSSSGAMTGYSGGEGIPTKLWLLRHEGTTLAS